MSFAGRLAALTGAAAGLALAPVAPRASVDAAAALALASVAALALAAVRPRAGATRRAAWPWIAAVGVLAAVAGLLAGGERLTALDAAAYSGAPGGRVAVHGYVAALPRPEDGMVTVPVETGDGRLAIEAPEPARELRVGDEVRATGVVRAPEPWRADRLRTAGVSRLLTARSVEPTGRRRGGFSGLVDELRDRAEGALERDVTPREAALARGFVLGQDDRIDPATVDDFRRSGLAHLLAVSGQNVLLLALLAIPVLALLGVPLRPRLVAVLVLIALYVPITGAGPSIQRAAVMGAAGLVAVLAGRPSRRWYALLLAAVVTLAVNPRAAGDVGWQLSFVVVVGILLWARPLARLARGGSGASHPRRALAEGFGVTLAATAATAPVSALHFETLTLAALPANLLALPAVAPVMWLGMLSGALGQLGWFPVEPLNWTCSLLVGYIAQVANWLAAPDWAAIALTDPGPVMIVALAAASVCAGTVLVRATRRRGGLSGAARPLLPAACAAIVFLAGVAGSGSQASEPPPPGPRLTLSVLDVGQGDAILLDPEPGGAILVDAGPPGSDLPAELRAREIASLSAAVVTHDQSDHAGGLAELLAAVRVGSVLSADAGRRLRAAARAAGTETSQIERGDSVEVGALELEVLWPPAADLSRAAEESVDPNSRSIVLLARWRRFRALLTGDAEAEAVPIDPGPVDLLKVAHHGSEDAGLPALLERTDPRLAAISVGAGNPYGHPHPATLAALADAHVPVARTDREGDIDLELSGETMRLGD